MNPISVSQVNSYIERMLKLDPLLNQLTVKGEISNLNINKNGNIFFSLLDESSKISCSIWSNAAEYIDIESLENGQEIVVIGSINVYKKNGSYSLNVAAVESYGEGALMIQFNKVKKKLEKQGLFDSKYKKPIPYFAERVGVITSATGAAIYDIKKIITQKNNITDILIFPTIVQGSSAPDSICKNIIKANKVNCSGKKIDVLIVGRGGGSAEDLDAFNNENVAMAVFHSEIPVISAVGHESDFSITDFVADMRAETPTAAADISVIDTYALQDDIKNAKIGLYEKMYNKYKFNKLVLNRDRNLLLSTMQNKIANSKAVIQNAMYTLRENNPEMILDKGYSLVLDGDSTISDIDEIDINRQYKVMLKNGTFTADIISKEKKSNG